MPFQQQSLHSGLHSLVVTCLKSSFKGKTSWDTALGLAYSSIGTGLIPFVLLVEHQATLARRLHSKTYTDLNWMLLLISGVSILTAPHGTFRPTFFIFIIQRQDFVPRLSHYDSYFVTFRLANWLHTGDMRIIVELCKIQYTMQQQ